eukprot:scaffold4012_cov109-Isochrysis_galbana.AAC.2
MCSARTIPAYECDDENIPAMTRASSSPAKTAAWSGPERTGLGVQLRGLPSGSFAVMGFRLDLYNPT